MKFIKLAGALTAICGTNPVCGDIFKYVSPDGRVYFTDEPRKGFDYRTAIRRPPQESSNEDTKPSKSKKSLENSKQPKIARVSTIKNYDLPKSLGLPDIFPAKYQDCIFHYQDASNILTYLNQVKEKEISRSLVRKDSDSHFKLLSSIQNTLQLSNNLNRWYADCRKQSDNLDD
ncbi:hypothetical protein [Methylomonas koyamae]|uniref:hypothetical protein n=1 Tax=Methylomonas koyamae TaxID=702114 RepID=UPI000B24A516|nr:hypothetical protein [Methylomonas koyamae]